MTFDELKRDLDNAPAGIKDRVMSHAELRALIEENARLQELLRLCDGVELAWVEERLRDGEALTLISCDLRTAGFRIEGKSVRENVQTLINLRRLI